MAKASPNWQAEINKCRLFVIAFAYHWKKEHGNIPPAEFQSEMFKRLQQHEAEGRVGNKPSPNMTQPVGQTTRPVAQPMQPAVLTTTPMAQTKKPVVGTNKPVGHTINAFGQMTQPVGHLPVISQRHAREAPVAGSSSLRSPVNHRTKSDAAMARQLHEALNQDVPSFRELDEAGSSMDEDDDVPEPTSEEENGKGKGKAKGQGKAKAGQQKQPKKGVEPLKKQPPVQPAAKVKEPTAKEAIPAKKAEDKRPRPQPSGTHYDKPCPECARWKEACQKDVRGGACIGCKTRKVKCPYAPPRPTRSKKKSKPLVSDNEDGGITSDAPDPAADAGVIYVPRAKVKPKRPAARKAAKAITDQEMAAATDADDKVAKPARKRPTKRATVPKETEELVEVIKSKLIMYMINNLLMCLQNF